MKIDSLKYTDHQQEWQIKGAYDGFKKIIFRDHTQNIRSNFNSVDLQKIKNQYKSLDDIKSSDLDTVSKLYWLHDSRDRVFNL